MCSRASPLTAQSCHSQYSQLGEAPGKGTRWVEGAGQASEEQEQRYQAHMQNTHCTCVLHVGSSHVFLSGQVTTATPEPSKGHLVLATQVTLRTNSK